MALSGTGFVPSLIASSASVNFGSQALGTTSSEQFIFLQNWLPATVTVNSVALSSTLDFSIFDGCVGTVAAGDSCDIVVEVTPQGTGQLTAVLNVVYTAPGAAAPSTLQVSLQATGQTNSAGLTFIAVTPCRVADTRNPAGAFGGPSIAASTRRDFAIPSSACGIPSTAGAYSLNVTAVPAAKLGYRTVWAAGKAQPNVSTLNSDGRVKASAAIVAAGTNGAVSVYASDTTDVILDVNGYFAAPGTTPSLAFNVLDFCRVVDTRNETGALGGPFLKGGQRRTFPILTGPCEVPNMAEAYLLNLTAIPHGPLGYLATFPTGQSQPLISTLNALNGLVTANSAIVAAGTNGSIDVYSTNDTDLVIDISGYFGPLSQYGLAFFPTTPCRLVDTRNPSPGTLVNGMLTTVDLAPGPCAAQFVRVENDSSPPKSALVLNATVVPSNTLRYLSIPSATLSGMEQPLTSLLNSLDGAVTSNMTVVLASFGGSLIGLSLFATDPTYLIIDTSGYFFLLNLYRRLDRLKVFYWSWNVCRADWRRVLIADTSSSTSDIALRRGWFRFLLYCRAIAGRCDNVWCCCWNEQPQPGPVQTAETAGRVLEQTGGKSCRYIAPPESFQ